MSHEHAPLAKRFFNMSFAELEKAEARVVELVDIQQEQIRMLMKLLREAGVSTEGLVPPTTPPGA